MEPTDTYQDFYHKIDRLLQLSDSEAVLSGLTDLAQGKEAIFWCETIPSLQGLGEQPEPSDNSYQDAMMELLLWGLRNFPIQPTYSAVRLWSAMAELDGVGGYNRQILHHQEYIRSMRVEPDDGRVTMYSNTLPSIVTESGDNNPVRKFLASEFTYITEYMKNEPDVRVVAVTASLFGWSGLSVQLIVLYVDSEGGSKGDLAKSAAASDMPVIIIEAEICDIINDLDEARDLVEPSGMDKLAHSERNTLLRDNLAARAPWKLLPRAVNIHHQS